MKRLLPNPTSPSELLAAVQANRERVSTLTFEEHQEFLRLSLEIPADVLLAHMNGDDKPIKKVTKSWPKKYRDAALNGVLK